MNGYNGKIARINLTSKTISMDTPDEAFYRTYLGGRGFIITTLLKEVPRGIDPLGDENKLVFALGPITGHALVGSGRHSVGCKSPLTGGYGEAEAGGYWGNELKRAGFDALIIEGAAAEPVYLWIRDGEIEIRDARSLWGLEVAETQNNVRQELKDNKIRTAAIGPAGENQVRFACVIHDTNHAAGRTGTGAVMGSKKLKAIAVRGSRAPQVAARDQLREINRLMLKDFKARTQHWMVGTGRALVNNEKMGNVPIRNFKAGRFPGIEKITPQILCERYLEKMDGCFGCPIRCKRVVKLETPYAVDPAYGAPEYETLGALGANCGIDNLEAIVKANELCNRYGLDTISTGVVISFAMECFENGLITPADTEGLELTFGNHQAMLDMVERIARRRGLGNLLAEGTKRAAETIGNGAEEFAMQVKGEEIPMHEPRLKQAQGVHYSIHATGADHATGVNARAPLDADSARMLREKGFSSHLVNYLGLCKFVPWKADEIKAALESITGWQLADQELAAVVERCITLARIFNLREGFTAKDDRLPKRFESAPPDSPLTGIDPKTFSETQRAYYGMLGWDEAGVPTPARLKALDIQWAADYLQR